jgi:hypothetical protein
VFHPVTVSGDAGDGRAGEGARPPTPYLKTAMTGRDLKAAMTGRAVLRTCIQIVLSDRDGPPCGTA